ncbi:helix-turn-helix domain-containing protein [Parerythrobacter lacustris]|uniref:AraC family transcriptional regulator n=1 Tax=Parerythrobacter lacustris TaxID=2969984 RepID=A0ABT1XTS9_9SPHN|nr:AraC family transcriptional regulator [Parerythrobacter lacustris]MCR2835075.1 AraC family transcriptional regulator [Parerythrobacter lacustris]
MLLSRTFRPSEALAPFVRRFYVFEAELPEEMVIEDFLLAETAFVRCLLKGDWKGEVAPGEWSQPGRTLFFGANARPFGVRVQGSFAVAGFAIRPSGWKGLFESSHREFADRLLTLQELWGDIADTMQAGVEQASDDAGKLAAMEGAITERLDAIGTRRTDRQMAKFEVFARTDSGIRVEDAAREVGLSVRQLERRCQYTFGLTPKAILRRSRFLDMATAMRGFSSPSDHDLASLRYFDQSHVAREFRRFTGMTPTEFTNRVTPLQTAGLKLREESRFED